MEVQLSVPVPACLEPAGPRRVAVGKACQFVLLFLYYSVGWWWQSVQAVLFLGLGVGNSGTP